MNEALMKISNPKFEVHWLLTVTSWSYEKGKVLFNWGKLLKSQVNQVVKKNATKFNSVLFV